MRKPNLSPERSQLTSPPDFAVLKNSGAKSSGLQFGAARSQPRKNAALKASAEFPCEISLSVTENHNNAFSGRGLVISGVLWAEHLMRAAMLHGGRSFQVILSPRERLLQGAS